MAQSAKPITSPVPESSYPTLAFVLLAIGLVLTASFVIYEATSSRKGRSLTKELVTGGVASLFLGFGSLFLLLSCGVYVFDLPDRLIAVKSSSTATRSIR